MFQKICDICDCWVPPIWPFIPDLKKGFVYIDTAEFCSFENNWCLGVEITKCTSRGLRETDVENYDRHSCTQQMCHKLKFVCAIRDPAPCGPFVCSKGGEGIAELREVSARVEGIASRETRFDYGYRVMTSAPRVIPGNLATIPSPIFVQCKRHPTSLGGAQGGEV